ncbi:sialidase family protein [Puniceicoccus vermicola]|uniref:Exo-alpha-sialidase n=1 Tax=Puniceicoccus vermicola TaxID=388746 RepID=A0A7X1B1A3_9BACT|nr:sialidase family protein [Puniceicoccus vermicola]MBC2602698.1 exo-alpha-sialidase [Puniceicoccus vermicola]
MEKTNTIDYQEIPTALDAPEIISSPGPEYQADKRPFQGIPTVERSPTGRLWAAWYAGGDWECWQNYVVVVTSDNDGCTWSDPRWVVAPGGTVRAFDPCLWMDPENRLWLFWAQSMAAKVPKNLYMDGRFGVWAMVCENHESNQPTWAAPRYIGDGIMMNKPTVLESGAWLLPISIWKKLKEGEGQAPPLYHDMGKRIGAYAVVSRDSGKTFEYLGKSDQHEKPSFDEHMFVERRDGSIWMLIRTDGGMWETFSCDQGRSWEKGNLSSVRGESSRFFIRRLKSGNLLLVRNDFPEGQQPNRSHLTAYLSEDDGFTWKGGLLLDERSKVSYPDGTESEDGTIYVIYDYNRTEEREVLMASFNESEVLAGRFETGNSRFKILVNKASGSERVAHV